MARETLANIISRMRILINDQASGSYVFSDDELQVFLDQNHKRVALIPVNGTGDDPKFFETDVAWEIAHCFDLRSADITPNTATDLLEGYFEFDSTPGQLIYISGKQFDLNGAAADICEAWMQKVKFDYDFSADSQSYKESQKFQHLKELSANFRSKAIFTKESVNSAGTQSFDSVDWSSNA